MQERKLCWLRTDLGVGLVLFVCISTLYFATVSGITSSNDGSHYALTRALAEQKSFIITDYAWYAEGNDIAIRGEHIYSDRPPGNALAASLFYTVGKFLPPPLEPLKSRYDAENPRLLYVMLLPVWAGAGAVALLYLLMRELGVSAFGSLTASLVFALGTTHWKYSSVLFSHAPSSFTVILSVYLAIRSRTARWPLFLALGLVAGLAVLIEYSNGILVAIIGLYVLFNLGRLDAKRLGLFVAGGLVSAVFMAYYNNVNFGGVFKLSYAHAVNYPWAGNFSSTFSFPLRQGLGAMLFWGKGGGWCNPDCYNQGFLLLSPALFLSLLGLWPYFRRTRREFALTNGLFLVYLALFAKHHTFHGFTGDGRYLTPFIGLWCIPLGFFIDRYLCRVRRSTWLAVAYFVFYALVLLSVRNIFLHIGFSYNYDLDLGQLSTMIASPDNWSLLFGRIFCNTGNLPILWLLQGMSILLLLAGRWMRARRRTSQTPTSGI